MKKRKILPILLITFIMLTTNNVSAFNKNASGTYSSDSTDFGLRFPGLLDDKGKIKKYFDAYFTVTLDSGVKAYDAYCLDPGYSFSGTNDLSCTPFDSIGMTWLLNNLTGDHLVDELAVRMTAVLLGYNQSTQGKGAEIVKYLQARERGDTTAANTYFVGTNDYSNNTIETAYQLAYQARAIQNSGSYPGGSQTSTSSTNVQVTFNKTNTNPTSSYYEATWEVTFTGNFDKNLITFECENNICDITNVKWNNNNNVALVTLRVKSPNCSYRLIAKYPITNNTVTYTPYFCETKGVGKQNLLAVFNTKDVSSSNSTAISSVSEIIDSSNGGNYYNNYCTNVNRCDQTTTVTNPTFCDNSNDQQLTVTSPSHVKSCILKNSDESGNSYELADLRNNPYCSVWCKEDYHMTMPGAQFTTSGSYFTTRNVVVTGTKTCYTTSPNSETDPNKTSIDYSKFLDDVKKAQENLRDAYNAYIEATAKDKYVNENGKQNGNCYKLTGSSSIPYSKMKLSDFNSSTGEYTVTYETATTSVSSTEWGTCTTTTQGTGKWIPAPNDGTYGRTSWEDPNACLDASGRAGIVRNCDVPQDNNTTLAKCTKSGSTYKCEKYIQDNGSSSTTTTTQPSYVTNEIKKNLMDANNALAAVVKNISSCYTWNINYCFNPTISFDYQEQYLTNTNFEQISRNEGQVSVSGSKGSNINENYDTNDQNISLQDFNFLSIPVSEIRDPNTNEVTGYNVENVGHNNKASVMFGYNYIKKTQEINAEYNNSQKFQSNYPHGTISTVADKNNVRTNYAYLGAVFPVAMKTEYGVYNWKLNISNLGQYYNSSSCSLGRLDKVANSVGSNLDYVCVYVVDCPDCEYDCACPSSELLPDGYSCDVVLSGNNKYCRIVPPCEGNDCDFYCQGKYCNFCTDEGCILTDDEKFFYRPVSLTDLFNSRTPGPNWNNAKGQAAKNEIEKTGENAYIKPLYSITITPTQQKEIRNRNKNLLGGNSYYDVNGITFHDANGYPNFYATSDFLNDTSGKYFTITKANLEWKVYPGATSYTAAENRSPLNSVIGPKWKVGIK